MVESGQTAYSASGPRASCGVDRGRTERVIGFHARRSDPGSQQTAAGARLISSPSSSRASMKQRLLGIDHFWRGRLVIILDCRCPEQGHRRRPSAHSVTEKIVMSCNEPATRPQSPNSKNCRHWSSVAVHAPRSTEVATGACKQWGKCCQLIEMRLEEPHREVSCP